MTCIGFMLGGREQLLRGAFFGFLARAARDVQAPSRIDRTASLQITMQGDSMARLSSPSSERFRSLSSGVHAVCWWHRKCQGGRRPHSKCQASIHDESNSRAIRPHPACCMQIEEPSCHQ